MNFSKSDKSKIGNALIYAINHCSTPVSKTKLLKLVYLMEETMARVYHAPFLSLPYEVWQYGAVQKDLYAELSDGCLSILRDYVGVGKDGNFIAKQNFDDEEFSDEELEMMKSVMDKYGDKTANHLVNVLHKKGSLWYKTAERNGVLNSFKEGLATTSPYLIDLTEGMDDCQRQDYLQCREIRQTASELRSKANV